MVWCLLLTLAMAQAPDADKARAAEARRLTLELTSYAAEGKRAGVERTYRTLLGIDPRMAADLHVLAARAAQERGDALLTLARLQRVPLGSAAQAEAAKTLDGLLTRYGYVRISVPEGTPMQGPTMFSPMERAAIAFAAEVVEAEGHFVGLLPAGSYTLGDDTLQVVEAQTANLTRAPE